MQESLEQLPIDGHIVIGASERGGAARGGGSESAPAATRPTSRSTRSKGAAIVARGGSGAMSMIAAGPSGSFPTLPDMYMRKMAVGPVARGKIDLKRPVAENIEAIADGLRPPGRRRDDDRPRPSRVTTT